MSTIGPIVRGDTRTIAITLASASAWTGGAAVWFTAVSGNGLFTIAKTLAGGGITYPGSGVVGTVTILPADTDSFPDGKTTLYWDVQHVKGGVVTTIDSGTMIVLADITRAVV